MPHGDPLTVRASAGVRGGVEVCPCTPAPAEALSLECTLFSLVFHTTLPLSLKDSSLLTTHPRKERR